MIDVRSNNTDAILMQKVNLIRNMSITRWTFLAAPSQNGQATEIITSSTDVILSECHSQSKSFRKQRGKAIIGNARWRDAKVPLSKMRIRDSVEVVLGPPLTMRVGGLAGRRFGFRRMTKADGEGGRPTERRATERNCPPLLLSIIWESNVSPPRHSGEAFWGFGWRQGRASGGGEAETGREDA